jgi:hypothetical protein
VESYPCDEVMPSGNNFIGPEGAGLKNQFSRDFNRFLRESSGTPDRKFLAGKPPKLPDEKKMRGLREGYSANVFRQQLTRATGL